jgi:FkbH-like protein
VKFLEAHQLVSRSNGGTPLPFLLAMSGTAAPLELYVRAHALQRGLVAELRSLEFNTLHQALVDNTGSDEREVFLLFPWDLVPALDWRTGLGAEASHLPEMQEQADRTLVRIAARPLARLLYVPAAIPPVFTGPQHSLELARWLESRALASGARLLPSELFQLSSYLASGCPIGGVALSSAAEQIVAAAADSKRVPMKLLVTDLDNVMWAGVIGEDGLDGIACAPDGRGFRHFLYQTYLTRLQRSGALVAAVSRNDQEIAMAPFVAKRTAITDDAFVCIVGSYSAKSSQIRQIAEQLNLGLASTVFVDDNPVELAEVAAQLPDVTCVEFPHADDGLPSFLDRLADLFATDVVTAEDRERTKLYRRRLAGMAPSDAEGADLTGFLKQLEMKLVIRDRRRGDRARAVQLINKTNHFNLNGRRVTDEEVAAMLDRGGSLFTAALSDRHGDHGEILSLLMSEDGVAQSLVLSCRVFQRQVEHAFFNWLVAAGRAPTSLRFSVTPRNEPIQRFLQSDGFEHESDGVRMNVAAFQRAYSASRDLFEITAVAESDDRETVGYSSSGTH